MHVRERCMDALRGGASTSAARETVVFWDFEGY